MTHNGHTPGYDDLTRGWPRSRQAGTPHESRAGQFAAQPETDYRRGAWARICECATEAAHPEPGPSMQSSSYSEPLHVRKSLRINTFHAAHNATTPHQFCIIALFTMRRMLYTPCFAAKTSSSQFDSGIFAAPNYRLPRRKARVRLTFDFASGITAHWQEDRWYGCHGEDGQFLLLAPAPRLPPAD